MRKQYARYKSINLGGTRVNEHTLIAERALGRKLPAGAEVHHVDGDGRNNAPSNLVICQDGAYHKLLHIRTEAYEACGNANYRWCQICKAWGDPQEMLFHRWNSYHRQCYSNMRREQYAVNKDKILAQQKSARDRKKAA